jgi:type IV pilus assembly protein PilB
MDTSEQSPAHKELLGEILVKRRLITEEQLNKALDAQKKEGCYLGQALIKLGFVEERDVVVALVVQCNLPYIAIDKYELDSAILQLVPEDFLRKHSIIPLDRVGDILSVVMADPLNLVLKKELERITNCQIASFIATRLEIERAINRWFSKGR